jgi:hypothetical protein
MVNCAPTNLQNQSQEFLPIRLKEAAGKLGFLVFLCGLSVFAVRMLLFFTAKRVGE